MNAAAKITTPRRRSKREAPKWWRRAQAVYAQRYVEPSSERDRLLAHSREWGAVVEYYRRRSIPFSEVLARREAAERRIEREVSAEVTAKGHAMRALTPEQREARYATLDAILAPHRGSPVLAGLVAAVDALRKIDLPVAVEA